MMRFPLGRLVATSGATKTLDNTAIVALVRRHVTGDWGTLDAHDRATNERAVREGTRILSEYIVNGAKIWIITEWDRSVTTVLLPEEY
jgi:hypothetical protein